MALSRREQALAAALLLKVSRRKPGPVVQPNPDNRPRTVKPNDPYAKVRRKQTPAAALKAMEKIQEEALRRAGLK